MQDQGTPGAGERYARDDMIGAKYRLVRRLDEGGMGTVWVAHNVDLDIDVAIKLIRSELGPAAQERLLNEARILARLEHPSIIRVFDCGKTALGDPFIAMELLAGECLADTLAREAKLPALRAVQTLLPIAEAIAVAHERGIVHRDVKPENIFLSSADGRVLPKILDFGIARSEAENVRLTMDGTLLGSPAYMSPEQARGGQVDARTDIWALSVAIYEVIAGRSPFEGQNYNATLRAIIEDEPTSLVELSLADALLSSIVERGLAKDRNRRFQSMRELGLALAQWLLSEGVEEDVARTSLRAAWLGESSRPSLGGETSLSIPPVTLPASESERPSRPLPHWVRTTPIAISATDEKHRARSRGGWLVVGAVAVLALFSAALWQSLAASPSTSHSADQPAEPEPDVERSLSRQTTPRRVPAPKRHTKPEPVAAPATETKISPSPAADAGARPARPSPRVAPRSPSRHGDLKIPY